MSHSSVDSNITIYEGKKIYVRKNERYIKKQTKNPFYIEIVLSNKIQFNFFSLARNRKCLNLGYDFQETSIECGKNILKYQKELEAPSQGQNLRINK
jgi:hypothetical protein